MKKIIMRIIGSLCLLASFAILFFPACMQIGGVARKDLREYRKNLLNDLEQTQVFLLANSTLNAFEDDLEDNNLPHKKSDIQERFEETEEILKELLDEDVSLRELFILSLAAPKYLKDTENLLETDVCAEVLCENSKYADFDLLQDVVDTVHDFSILFYVVLGVIIFLMVLVVASAVTHVLNRVRFLKYIYIGFVILLTACLIFLLPILSETIQSEMNLAKTAEDLSLVATMMPTLAIVPTLVPIMLDMIFEGKKKKPEESPAQ